MKKREFFESTKSRGACEKNRASQGGREFSDTLKGPGIGKKPMIQCGRIEKNNSKQQAGGVKRTGGSLTDMQRAFGAFDGDFPNKNRQKETGKEKADCLSFAQRLALSVGEVETLGGN